MKTYSQLSPREQDIVDHMARGSRLVTGNDARWYLAWPNGKRSNVMQDAAAEVAALAPSWPALLKTAQIEIDARKRKRAELERKQAELERKQAELGIEVQQRKQGNRPVPRIQEPKRQPAPVTKPTAPPTKNPPFRPQAMALRTFDLGKALAGAK